MEHVDQTDRFCNNRNTLDLQSDDVVSNTQQQSDGNTDNRRAQGNSAKKYLELWYTNADSLNNKVSELNAILEIDKLDVVCITETLPKNTINREEYPNIELLGYEGFHSNTGRGVSIYVKNSIRSEKIELDSEFNDNIWVRIKVRADCSILIGCIYRSPNSNSNNNDALLKLIQTASEYNTTYKVLVGDFNYKEVDWENGTVHAGESHPAAKIYDKINDLFLNQLVMSPTRYREGERENLLDWVITDSIDIIEKVNLEPPLGEKGDHCVITVKINCNYDTNRYGDQLNYYKANFDSMRKVLEDINWEERLRSKDVNEAWGEFRKIMTDLTETFIPKKKSKCRKSQPWVNLEVKNAIKEKK